ncbi:MAG: peptide chain release factor N(5)-glutamine methyltransferase [Mobilicoccus sp.]|nr:peptide chain release factor N(5)-glutamine methyltransferase [Mobilicoccus sp.]
MSAPLDVVLAHTRTRLTRAGITSADAEARVLLAHMLGVDRGELARRLILGGHLPADVAPTFAALVSRRCAREPLQHLTGLAAFRRLELHVGPGVFVPRPETEVVAGLAIDALRLVDGRRPIAVDLCTGSGAIALALADEVPEAIVHAVELSQDALAWTRRNVEHTGLEVTVHAGDATDARFAAVPELAALTGTVDVVVSNPPYIPSDMVPVDVEVAEHDPHQALYGGGDDGLDIPRRVLAAAAALLRPGGVVVMEHADTQSDALVGHLRAAGGWREVTAHDDLTGRPRAVSARREMASGIPGT